MKKSYSFIELLSNECSKGIVEQIEELSGETEKELVRIRECFIAQLKREYNYIYVD